jgi:hypothetical protein
MFEAQLLHGASDPFVIVYSPWFPRGGDNARFTLEIVAVGNVSGSVALQVDIYHKNSEDTGDGGVHTSNLFSGLTSAAGRSTQEVEALKELVRYRYVVKDGSSDWVLFRMLPPVWFDAVSA